eukprot:1598076-Alexandrium_andersonii.AAC.1
MEEKWSLYVRETEKPKLAATAAAAAPAAAAPAGQCPTTPAAATTTAAAANPSPVPSPAAAAQPPQPPQPKPSAKAKAKAKAGRKGAAAAAKATAATAAAADGADGGQPPADDKDLAKKVGQSIKKATSIKNMFLQLMAQCEELNKEIDSDASWVWAKNPFLQGELQSSMEAVREAINDFARSFLYKDIKVVRSESESPHQLLTDLD